MGKHEVESYRMSKDRFFKTSHQSPLTPKQQDEFTGLKYYPYNEKYDLQLKLNRYDNPEIVVMGTSDNQEREYYKIGFFEFELDERQCTLQVYQDLQNKDYYFLPFMDGTTGKETYGAGRYLEIEHMGDDIFKVDFNLAYSPFCAYNDNYSCPIPPYENMLPVEILAGEKSFHD